MEASRWPPSAEEGFEIVRRRLSEPIATPRAVHRARRRRPRLPRAGEASLADPRRPIPELTRVVDEVVGRLAQQTDVRLRVSVSIEAEHAGQDGENSQ